MTEQEQIEFLKERGDYHLKNLQELSRDEMMHFLPAMLANKDLAAYAAGLAARVPEGWKLVPIEPTPDMVRYGNTCRPIGKWHAQIKAVYAAMLAAAPEPKP